MKKMTVYLFIVFFIFLIVSFSGCQINPGIEKQPGGGSRSTNTNGNNLIVSNGIFSFYSDTFASSVNWDGDTKLDIWFDPENNIPLTLSVSNQSNSTGEGGKAWRINGLSPSIDWIGFGIRAEPIANTRDLSAYTNGSLNFMFRGTKPFKVGLKDGHGVQQWIKPLRMSYYGLQTNDTWCQISIPLKLFDQIDFSQIQQYFMWTADTTMGYTTNRAYYLDNIFWSDQFNGVMDNFEESNWGIYSESVEQSINMNYDTELYLWEGGEILTNDADDFGEGSRSWQLTSNPASWMGLGICVYPESNLKDMRAYTNGALHFMYQGNKIFTKVGIESRGASGRKQVWISGSNMAANYGLRADYSWCSVTIPMSIFVSNGLELDSIYQYFMWVQDSAGDFRWYYDMYHLDNIYWSKY